MRVIIFSVAGGAKNNLEHREIKSLCPPVPWHKA